MPSDSLSLSHFFQSATTDIDAALSRFTDFDEECPSRLRDAIRYSLLAPGKRLRPMLVLIAAEACGSTREAAMPAACAVEMIHAYSLIHDDLPAMDDDDMRRGRPTCHIAFDEALAILAGDALQARAFEMLAKEIRPPERAAACCAELGHAAGASALVGGQVDDLAAEFSTGGLAELERIHRRKTGAMFLVSLRLGGVVAGAGAGQMNALDQYGRCLGLAFQIVDDLLDVGGDTAAMGKRVAKDSGRGKLTFPALLGVAESRQRAASLVREASEAVEIFGDRAGLLRGLAQFVLERNR